jgi:ATP-dependent helicase YprA (DUF1998 family)
VAYLFLFDTLSGGAGYATQAGRYIEQLLQKTQQILDNCPDHCDQSCYRCLRTYQNRIQHHRLDRHLAGTLLCAINSGLTPDNFSVAQQIEELRMLQRYLELSGMQCESSVMVEDIPIPLLVKMSRQTVAIGAYPVQQDHQVIKHPLTALSKNQIYLLFNDYDLAHDLPHIAHKLLSFV